MRGVAAPADDGQCTLVVLGLYFIIVDVMSLVTICSRNDKRQTSMKIEESIFLK